MWNVSALSVPQTLTCKMTGELAILLTFMVIGIPSTHISLNYISDKQALFNLYTHYYVLAKYNISIQTHLLHNCGC